MTRSTWYQSPLDARFLSVPLKHVQSCCACRLITSQRVLYSLHRHDNRNLLGHGEESGGWKEWSGMCTGFECCYRWKYITQHGVRCCDMQRTGALSDRAWACHLGQYYILREIFVTPLVYSNVQLWISMDNVFSWAERLHPLCPP